MSSPKYEVRKNGKRVLTFSAEPGTLVSTAARPPGFTPPSHPFVHAQAHDALFEHKLAALLQGAKSVDQFVELLKKDGFDVTAVATS